MRDDDGGDCVQFLFARTSISLFLIDNRRFCEAKKGE